MSINWLFSFIISFLPTSQNNVSGSAYHTPDFLGAVVDTSMGNKFVSDGGKFSIMLPDGYGEPTQSSKPISTAAGSVDMIMYQSEKDANHLCMIAYSDYPGESVEDADPNKVLDAAMNGSMKSLKAKVIKKSVLSLNGYPGRSCKFTMSSAGRSGCGQFNTYFVSPRLYQVCYLAIDKPKSLDNAGIKNYFASFNFTK